MARDLTPLFFPRSVAVIGASDRPDSLAGAVLRNLVAGGFPGDLAAVHPTAARVAGAALVPNLGALPFAPDLAVWGVPFEVIDQELPRLLEAGTRAHLVLSAGFAETGALGARRERSLADRIRERNGVLLGPNCMGLHVARPGARLDASFSRARPAPGATALLVQSGSIGEWLLLRMVERGLGAALVASAGNLGDLDLVDLVEAIPAHFPEVRRVLLYLETVPEATRLRRAIAALPEHVRVLALRGGTTALGARAVAGHTGALASDPALAAALLLGVGIEPVESLTMALDTLEVLDRLRAPLGRRAGVVTNAGGPGVLAADALAREGFTLPAFSPTLQAGLRSMLPPAAVLENPVDMLATATPACFETCLARLAESDEVDVIVPVFMHPVTVDAGEIAAALDRGLGGKRDQGVVCWLADPGADAALAALRARGIAAISDPDRAARALGLWANPIDRAGPQWPDSQHHTPPQSVYAPGADAELLPDLRLPGGAWGDPAALESFLDAPHHRIPPHARTGDLAAVPAAAAQIGFPLILKVETGVTPHKVEAGLLAVLRADGDLSPALARLAGIAPRDARWLLQRRVPPGPEIYVGFLRHPRLGAFVGIAPGGAGVEARSGAAWISVPSPAERVLATLRESPAAALLGGPDGPGVKGLLSLASAFARLERETTQVTMAEVNPAIWDGALGFFWLVDCRWSPN